MNPKKQVATDFTEDSEEKHRSMERLNLTLRV